MANDSDTSSRGVGSPKVSESKKREIRSAGGHASTESKQGAAGKTDAAKRGGENSHKNQNS